MKRTTILWACLAIFNASLIHATNDPRRENLTKVDLDTSAFIKSETAPKKLDLIPDATLNLKFDDTHKLLNVISTGLDNKDKDWIIYQEGGTVITRLKTSAIIDVINTNNFSKGQYLLMIKDQYNQALIKSFEVN